MFNYSSVMNFEDGADFLARKIFNYPQRPHLTVIEGISGIGKTYFCREVRSRLGFNKEGTTTKPHDLGREVEQNGILDFYLIENHDADYKVLIRDTQKYFQKNPDFRILILSDLSKVLDPPKITLEKLMGVFNLMLENSFYV